MLPGHYEGPSAIPSCSRVDPNPPPHSLDTPASSVEAVGDSNASHCLGSQGNVNDWRTQTACGPFSLSLHVTWNSEWSLTPVPWLQLLFTF